MSHNSDPQSDAIDEVLAEFDGTVPLISVTEADALAAAQFGGSVALTGFQPAPETGAEQAEEPSGAGVTVEAASSFNSAL